MHIRTIAMILGIIGGVSAIIPAILAGTWFGIAIASYSTFGGLLYVLLSVATPIAGLVGAGIVKKKPLTGSGLMALAGVGMIVFANIFAWFSSIYFFVAAIIGVIGKFQR